MIIAVPLFSRLDLLLSMLDDCCVILQQLGISVYVFDDMQGRDCGSVFERFNEKAPGLINYVPSRAPYGHDYNYQKIFNYNFNEYLWVVGDAIKLKPGLIQKVYNETIDNKYDFICLNTKSNRLRHVHDEFYSSSIDYVIKYFWHFTCTGVSVLSPRILREIRMLDQIISPEVNRNFYHAVIIAAALLRLDGVKIVNKSDFCISTHPNRSLSYWFSHICDVFVVDWSTACTSLCKLEPSIPFDDILRSHDQNSGVFSLPMVALALGCNPKQRKNFLASLEKSPKVFAKPKMVKFWTQHLPQTLCDMVYKYVIFHKGGWKK